MYFISLFNIAPSPVVNIGEQLASSGQIVTKDAARSLSLLDMFLQAQWVAQMTMVLLMLLSIYCWTIAISKWLMFRSLKKKIQQFESAFWSGIPLQQLFQHTIGKEDNPLAIVFTAAFEELNATSKVAHSNHLAVSKQERVEKSMQLATAELTSVLEKDMSFLATVASVSPFIGLFGTVWGIMNSFQSIALAKNATLAVVAPGIAEALLATALGLAAAIPAVVFYNKFANDADAVGGKVNNFTIELAALIARNMEQQ